MALKSDLLRGDPKLEAAAISHPAHIKLGANGEHVKRIQRALNQLDNANLVVDGGYGKKTADAVLAYKRKREIINKTYQGEADNIVGIMTLAAMDAELLGNDGGDRLPLTTRASGGGCQSQKQAVTPQNGLDRRFLIIPDPTLAETAVALVPKLRRVITATRFLLDAARPHVRENQTLVEPSGDLHASAKRSIRLLNTVFSLNKQKNPRPGFETISQTFKNMDVALNRSFTPSDGGNTVLFLPNRISFKQVDIAYTAAGGAFSKEDALIEVVLVAANRIYICPGLMGLPEIERVLTLVHELAHFVSRPPHTIAHDHGVPSAGFMRLERARFDNLPPNVKLRSAEHYGFFAIEASAGRVQLDETLL